MTATKSYYETKARGYIKLAFPRKSCHILENPAFRDTENVTWNLTSLFLDLLVWWIGNRCLKELNDSNKNLSWDKGQRIVKTCISTKILLNSWEIRLWSHCKQIMKSAHLVASTFSLIYTLSLTYQWQWPFDVNRQKGSLTL